MGKSEAKQTKNYGSACSRNSGSMYWITYIVGKSQKDQVERLRVKNVPLFFLFKIVKNVMKAVKNQVDKNKIYTYICFNIKINN